MLNLNNILSRKEEIRIILAKYGVQEYKLFGQIISQHFPLAADAHFLITPGQFTDSRNWNALQEEIRELFPHKNIRFYTLNTLNNMVKLETLKKEDVEQVEKTAINLDNLKNQSVLNANNKPVKKVGNSFFQEISEEEKRSNRMKQEIQQLSKDPQQKKEGFSSRK